MARLAPIGFDVSRRGDKRILRNSSGRVSQFVKLDRRDIAYLEWLRSHVTG